MLAMLALVAAIAALSFGIARRCRLVAHGARPGVRQPDAAPEATSGDFPDASRISTTLVKNGIVRFAANPMLADRIANASGGELLPIASGATPFGLEFAPAIQTAWLLEDTAASAAMSLLDRDGIDYRSIPLSGFGAAIIPAPPDDPQSAERPEPTGIFCDFSKSPASVRFIPTDDWVMNKISHIGAITVDNIAPLLERAPDSLALLKFLFANVGGKAREVLLEKIRENSPLFAEQSVNFGDRLVFNGCRVDHSGQKDGDGSPSLLLYFAITSGAEELVGNTEIRLEYAVRAVSEPYVDFFILELDSMKTISCSTSAGSMVFSIARPLPFHPEKGHWSFSMSAAATDENPPRLLKARGGLSNGNGGIIVDILDVEGGSSAQVLPDGPENVEKDDGDYDEE